MNLDAVSLLALTWLRPLQPRCWYKTARADVRRALENGSDVWAGWKKRQKFARRRMNGREIKERECLSKSHRFLQFIQVSNEHLSFNSLVMARILGFVNAAASARDALRECYQKHSLFSNVWYEMTSKLMYQKKMHRILFRIFIKASLIYDCLFQHTLALLMLAGALLRYCHIIIARAQWRRTLLLL